MKSLVWLRNDLRIDDNPALRSACVDSDEVSCIYIYSKEQNELHNEANCKIEFIISNLKDLSSTLKKINIPLTIIDSDGFSDNPSKILDVVNERSISKVYWNNMFGADENKRDQEVQKILDNNNIKHESFDDQVVYSPGTIKTKEDKPYSVFTPFKRRWIENFNIDFLDIEFKCTSKNDSGVSSNVDEFNFDFKKTHSVDMSLWNVGEESAISILNNYLDTKVLRYSKDRNDPIIDGTSRLSPYLASGIISSKRCILEALKKNNFKLDSGETGIVKWIDEIIWREFYKNIMHSYPKVSTGLPFQDYTKNIKWRFDKNEFEAWKTGKTGFPIIDSAMRQLNTEGWMHNRLRMVVAMFFTKNMLHDWRLGEALFYAKSYRWRFCI
jgi:deoxyribodipyrimidine photo-lyase